MILVEQDSIPALGHKEMDVEGYAPTCTATGLTDGVGCSACGVILVEQDSIPALGHKEIDVEGYAPTCTATGLTDGVGCSACGVILVEQDSIPALGHKEMDVEGYAPTCTATGLTDGVGCSACGVMLVEQETIPLKPHTEATVAGYAPSCTEKGLTDGVNCSECGFIIEEQKEIPAKGHTQVVVKGKDSTYTATGLTDGLQCSVCKHWFTKQETIAIKNMTIIYYPNGGNGTTKASMHKYDVSSPLTANGFTRHGWFFLGWSTNPKATTATYTDKQSVKHLMPDVNGNVSLYAVWSIHTSYEYYRAGGSFDIGVTADSFSYQFTIGDKVNIPDLISQGYKKVKITFQYTVKASDTIKTDSYGYYAYMGSKGILINTNIYESPEKMKLSETTKTYTYSATTDTSRLLSNNYIGMDVWIHASGGFDFKNKGELTNIKITVECLK